MFTAIFMLLLWLFCAVLSVLLLRISYKLGKNEWKSLGKGDLCAIVMLGPLFLLVSGFTFIDLLDDSRMW